MMTVQLPDNLNTTGMVMDGSGAMVWVLMIGLVIALVALAFLVRRLLSREQRLGDLQSQVVGLEERHAAACKEQERLSQERDMLSQKVQQATDELNSSRTRNTKLETELASERKKIEELKEWSTKAETQFEALAGRALDKNAARLEQRSQEKLQNLIQPLREDMEKFRTKVDDSFGQQGKEQALLKQEIQHIVMAKDQLVQSTENLTEALRGSSKVQGDWGEHILQSVLDSLGLRNGTDYTAQRHDIDFASNESGSRLRPDIVVNLPGDQHVVIDAKVSLRSYEAYVAAENDDDRGIALRQFLTSVRNHIQGLSSKAYHQAARDSSTGTVLDFTIMFMPTEPAWALVHQQAPDVIEEAWRNNIAVVSPTTLLATLRAVAHLWKIERFHANAKEIATRGGRLYDKFVGFCDTLDQVGKKMNSATDAYERAMRQLSTGSGNLVRQAEQLKQLGVDSKKSLSGHLVDTSTPSSPIEIESEAPQYDLDTASEDETPNATSY